VRWTAIGLALLLYAFQFVAGDKGLLRRFQLERQLEMMRVENTRLALQKDRLLQEVQLKENDPLSLERLAREKYWMVGPDEQIFRFREDEAPPDDGGEAPWLHRDPAPPSEGPAAGAEPPETK
jgi:cell division protein FtsB